MINFPSLGGMAAGENFKFIFREAKINDAILFFDECEAIFETREHGGHNVNLLLTEIERYKCCVYMCVLCVCLLCMCVGCCVCAYVRVYFVCVLCMFCMCV